MKSRLMPVLVSLAGLCCVAGADWPQWRGPDRTGLSKETGLLQQWPKNGPSLVWSINTIGLGYSGPAVVGDGLYVMGTRGDKEYVFALDTKDGKEIWAAEVGPIFRIKGNSYSAGPSTTPTIDGERLYALGGFGEFVCLETASGKRVWGHNLFKEFQGQVMDNSGEKGIGWGYTDGPLVDGDQVLCTPGGNDGLLLALNKKTGQVIWRSKEVKSKAPYSSIIATEVGGVRQYIQLAENGVVGVDANTGKQLWFHTKPNDDLVIRTPIIHNGHVFATYTLGSGSEMFQIIPNGQQFRTEKVYSNKNIKNEMGGVVLVGDYLYGYSDRVGWVCQNFLKAKGATTWEEKRKLGKGSVTYADGHLYCFTEDDGIAALVEANPKKWTEKGRFTIPQQTKQRASAGKIWSHPVVANGRLYLRDQELLFCYDVKQK
jgi:outer membrane protein assembly factor BamB